jgi:hypothetical protein
MILIILLVLMFFVVSLIITKYPIALIYGCISASVLLGIMYIYTRPPTHNEYALFAAIFIARGFWLVYKKIG